MVPNPFTFRRALGAGQLVDRQAELERLGDVLHDNEVLFLVGPRRFGKTSLLTAAVDEATRSGLPAAMINVEIHSSLASLAGDIVKVVSGLFRDGLQERSRRIARWFGMLRPEVKYDALTDSISVGVTAAPDVPEATTLAEALNAANALAADRGQRIAIVLDEFQQVSKLGGLPAERKIRSAIQTHEHVSYVFSGSDTSLMTALVSDHSRPFYRLGSTLHLGPIPAAEWETFIRDAFSTLGAAMAPGAIDRCVLVSDLVPYNIQKLCSRVFARARRAKSTRIEVADVDDALEAIIGSDHLTYHALFRSLTANQREVLTALAERRGHDFTLAQIARERGIAYSTAQSAQKALASIDLLRVPRGSTSSVMRFVDPFFAEWLLAFRRGAFA